MNEWRLFRGWTDDELEHRLARLDGLKRNFSGSPESMTPDAGWSRYGSEAVLAWEPPGPPLADGPFRRASIGIENYAFSDPAIVTAHFDPATPLPGRRILVEIRVLGLRWLCGVVVGAVRSESDAERDAFGFRYDTLEGHIERGHEWFLLTKSRGTGEIRYGIEAVWKPGDLPTWWSRVGFRLTVPIYHRIWHHRAQRRLHSLARCGDLEPPVPVQGRRLVHEGPPVVFRVILGRGAGTHFGRTIMERAAKLIGRITGVEARARPHGPRPRSRRRARRPPPWRAIDHPGGAGADAVWTAAALGAVAGLRSMAAPALLSRHLATTGGARTRRAPERFLASPAASGILALMAAGEALVDKLPFVPARTEPASLAGRALSGALCGAAVAARCERPAVPAALAGAGAAVAAAFAGYWLRRGAGRRLHAPDVVVALVEDLVVAMAGARAVATVPPAGWTPVRHAGEVGGVRGAAEGMV